MLCMVAHDAEAQGSKPRSCAIEGILHLCSPTRRYAHTTTYTSDGVAANGTSGTTSQPTAEDRVQLASALSGCKSRELVSAFVPVPESV